MAGKWEGKYPSQSEADMALCMKLAFWSGKDKEQMDRIFRTSGLFREKWDQNASPTTALYSMVERSKLTLADDSAVRRTNIDGTGDLTHAGLDYDIDTITTMFYSISNNPGVELPATGGPGTTAFYLLGLMLTAFADAGFVMWKRRRDTT